GRPLLLCPLVLSGFSGDLEAGFDRAIFFLSAGAGGFGAGGVVRLWGQVCGGDRGWPDLRDAVSSREEPAVGPPPAGEFRRRREGRAVIVIPAVDLRNGLCVRLHQGRSERETVFSDDPVSVALQWKKLGAERLHVVDLDGAF